MDMLPEIVVNLRAEARASIYRTALNRWPACCFGFLLGKTEPFVSPSVEFSLISGTPTSQDDFWTAPQLVRSQFAVCDEVAEHTGTKVMGLFVAWDDSLCERYCQLLGLWTDTAREMHLRYVGIFPTIAHEAAWAPSFFFVNRFPHDVLRCRIAPGKLSMSPHHNPRRVRALWRQLLYE